MPSTPIRHRPGLRLKTISLAVAVLAVALFRAGGARAESVTFVFTSDVHFGISRSTFRGASYVDARVVNAAMVQGINALPAVAFPADGGVRAGRMIGPVDFVAITGDLTNRQELYPIHIQSAATSWGQFETCFIDGLNLRDAGGRPTPLLLVPGNHDISNAIGAPTRLVPERDATALTQLYNRMLNPVVPRTPATYSYAADKINYARDFGGAHCVFLTIWPDRAARAWLERDLQQVSATTPVFLFCHDPPAIEARHLTNPRGAHDINGTDKFENLVGDIYADGAIADDGKKPAGETTIEQRALAVFLKAHRNIVGYFHGHSNWTEFYTWRGPDGDLALHVFRSDSPMKGKLSGKDETNLAFQVVAYDVTEQRLTARECLWNAPPATGGRPPPVSWGLVTTVSIAPRADN
mgnify:CR=1 FL=1